MAECGDCTICCDVPPIPSMGKPANTMCGNCDNGCTIYNSRPKSCREFECCYATNDWNVALRPDNCGVMIVNSPGIGYEAILVKEKATKRIKKMIQSIEKNYRIKMQYVNSK